MFLVGIDHTIGKKKKNYLMNLIGIYEREDDALIARNKIESKKPSGKIFMRKIEVNKNYYLDYLIEKKFSKQPTLK